MPRPWWTGSWPWSSATGRARGPAARALAACLLGGAAAAQPPPLPPGFTDQPPMIQLLEAYARYKMADYEGARLRWEAIAETEGAARAEALFELASLYEDGLAVPADPARALDTYRRAAREGSVRAAYRLGVLHATGEGVARDAQAARHWFALAAAAGDEDAADWLRRLRGDGEEPALAEADRLLAAGDAPAAAARLRELAEAGHARAGTRLALMHEAGRGVPRDLDTAARLLAASAEAGDPLAQYALGVMYATGRGREQDRDAARGLWQRAAAQGHSGAAAALETLRRESP